jgi:hypothetical protein
MYQDQMLGVISNLRIMSNSKTVNKNQNPINPTNPMDTFSSFGSTPMFDDDIYDKLPSLLQKVCNPFEDRERDMVLIGAITVLSACMPNIYGLYDNRKVYPNLYLFVAAPASSGKGVLNYSRNIGIPVHNVLKKSDVSVRKMLYIPADITSAGFIQVLGFNEGKGLFFETEGDTLSNTFKKEHGDYSDCFRKAFHHEMITFYRKGEKEHIEIPKPCLSALLSGTLNQVLSLIHNTEDGLLSRFMFYIFDIESFWKNVFDLDKGEDFDKFFLQIGIEYFKTYEDLCEISEETEFCFTKLQREHFNLFFEKYQDEYSEIWGSEFIAIIRRLAIIMFRIAMILTVLRKRNDKLICSEVDFEIAVSIIKVLLEHSFLIYSFVNEGSLRGITSKDKLIKSLTNEFSRTDYLKKASEIGIKAKTADKYIKEEIGKSISKPEFNKYVKL